MKKSESKLAQFLAKGGKNREPKKVKGLGSPAHGAQKGVHFDTGLSDSAYSGSGKEPWGGKYSPDKIKGGISSAGVSVRDARGSDWKGEHEHQAKQKHKKVLEEIRAMPKPKLTKGEMWKAEKDAIDEYMKKSSPLDRLKHHVTGAIERGEKKPVEAQVDRKMKQNKPSTFTEDEIVFRNSRSQSPQGQAVREYFNQFTKDETMKQTKPKQWLIGHVINPVGLRRPKVFDKHGPEFILIDGPDEQTANENAALIAAAPEMLEALESIKERLEAWQDNAREQERICEPSKEAQYRNLVVNYGRLIIEAKRAIAKAKGVLK